MHYANLRYYYMEILLKGSKFLKLFSVWSVSPCPGMMQPPRSYQDFDSRYRENSYSYDVKRDVYNEETFQQDYRRRSASSGNLDIDITTFKHHIQCRCVCVWSFTCHQADSTVPLFDSFWCPLLPTSSESLASEPLVFRVTSLQVFGGGFFVCVCALFVASSF